MDTNTPVKESTTQHINHGRNVQTLRRALGIKQRDLSELLNLSQSQLSRIENKEVIEDPQLIEIAKALKIPVELIKNFDAENPAKNFVNHGTLMTEGAGSINNQGIENEENNITVNDPDEFAKMYKEIIEEQKQIIAAKNQLIEELQRQLQAGK